MSEEMMNHGHSGHETEYEHEDLGSRGIFVFMIALAVSGAVIYFIIVGMYSFLDKYERSQMTTGSPLVSPAGEMSRVVTQEQMDKMFKDNGAPMLETNERGQFREFLIDQEDQLNLSLIHISCPCPITPCSMCLSSPRPRRINSSWWCFRATRTMTQPARARFCRISRPG